MPGYLGSTKHFLSKLKSPAITFTSFFTNPNHSNLSVVTTANETLTEFSEAAYSCNAQWTGGTTSAFQAVATYIRCTRVGNRVYMSIDPFAFTNDTTGTHNTRIVFSKKIDPRFVPKYTGVATTWSVTTGTGNAPGEGNPSQNPVMSFPIVFYYNGATSATAVAVYIYPDGLVTIEDNATATTYGTVLGANSSTNVHQTFPCQEICLHYDIVSGAVKTLP